MTTEIRMLFRSGPATTIKFDGSFHDFFNMLEKKSVQARELGIEMAIIEFPTFAINISELACASVYAVHPDPLPVEPKKDAKS